MTQIIKIKQIDECESLVDIVLKFIIVSENREKFCKEFEQLVDKYRI
jgi:hypothetical protein